MTLNRMNRLNLIAVFAVAVLNTLIPSTAHALGGDFQLTDHQGTEFRLSDHEGKVVAMVFGYSACPDVCPDTLMSLQNALALLPNSDDVQLVFIAVDSNRHSSGSLSTYLAGFDQRFIGLTGNVPELKEIAENWDVDLLRSGQSDSTFDLVDKSSDIYILARDGDVHGVVSHDMNSEHLAEILQSALARDQVNQSPDRGLVDREGQMVDVLANSANAKVLHFWATWCVPCREEFADLEAAKPSVDSLPVDFYAVSLGDRPDEINKFLDKYPLSYTILSDRTGYSGDNWQVQSLPMTILLSPRGEELLRLRGMQPWGDEQFIEKLRHKVQ